MSQPCGGYRYAIDAFLLADHTWRHCTKPAARLIDLGCGVGIVSLIMAHHWPQAQIWGVEVQRQLAELAQQNAVQNGLAQRFVIYNHPMQALDPAVIGGTVDVVVSNPPYRRNLSGRQNPDPQRAIARHEVQVTLPEVVQTARRLLRRGGRFFTIYPADRLVDLFVAMRQSQLEPKGIRMVQSRRGDPMRLFITEGVCHGRPGIKIHPPLTIYGSGEDYGREVARLLDGVR